jgi:uncharacterized membrane protein
MESVIRTLLGSIQLGDPVGDRGLTILPVLGEFTGVPPLVTLGEALAAGTLTITEVSLGGSVPDLKARNTAAVGVLIVDGEELAGAKQNRVLNTSVYIGPWQEVVIPVSCTEHGRWSYQSTAFSDSGHLSAVAVRMAAHDSVTRSARRGGGFRSDQGRVWEEVALLQERHRVASPTAAARDVYEARDETVRRRETAFTRVPGQLGLLALWSGRVVGLDVLGTSAAYARLHERFVRSYALDAPGGGPASVEADRRTAKEWLAGLAGSTVTVHESPGQGVAYRFTGSRAVGSLLAVDGAILHAVAFATEAQAQGRFREPRSPEQRYPGYFERRDRFPW